MLLKTVLMLFLGIIGGSITGLTPGIHVNTICLLILGIKHFLLTTFSPIEITVFIISMATAHTFIDAIPSVYLGAPTGEIESLIILPAHKMLLKGEGHNAVILTSLGSLFSLTVSALLVFFLSHLYKLLYITLKKWIGIALLGASLFVILKENKRFLSLAFFLISGILGIQAFRVLDNKALMPLLSGLFGISILILSLKGKGRIPPQKEEELYINKREAGKGIIGAIFASSIAAFLPGFGNAQAAITAQSLIGRLSTEGTLILLGGINTANITLSLATFLAISKARNGAIATIAKLISIKGNSSPYLLTIIIIATGLISGGIATLLAIYYSKLFIRLLKRLSYKKVGISIILLIFFIVILSTGSRGLLLLTTATALGITASLLEVRKSNLMGCLILPTLCYFFGLS